MAFRASRSRRATWVPAGETEAVVFHVRPLGLLEGARSLEAMSEVGPPGADPGVTVRRVARMIEVAVEHCVSWEGIVVEVTRGADGAVVETAECTEETRRLVFSQHPEAMMCVFNAATGNGQADATRPNDSGGGSGSSAATPGSTAASSATQTGPSMGATGSTA